MCYNPLPEVIAMFSKSTKPGQLAQTLRQEIRPAGCSRDSG